MRRCAAFGHAVFVERWLVLWARRRVAYPAGAESGVAPSAAR
jgi:hypothetical protein